jgi:hypothetical protein
VKALLRSLTWRVLSMIIGQLSLAGFGAHLIYAERMTDTLGLALAVGVVVLGIVGGLGEAGARHIVAGVQAWRRPDEPPSPPSGPT